MLLVYALYHFLFRDTSLWRVDATPIQTAPPNISYSLPISLLSLNSTSNDSAPLCNCNQRSILDIIWSCLVTLFLCTWVAVHPDVPGRHETSWKILGRRLKMMWWTIMFPELVLTQAVREFWDARRLFNKYKAPDHEWTMTHAHFLRMGGFYGYNFEFYTKSRDSIQFYTDSRDFFENRSDVLDYQALPFRNIKEADIQDKSKADGLSKIIVATQSVWFIVQCIGRLVKGLALTPLEVTTLAVTACTFMLSIIWWHKPFDVRQPILVPDTIDATSISGMTHTVAPSDEYHNEVILDREVHTNDEATREEGGSESETIKSLADSTVIPNHPELEDEDIKDSSGLGETPSSDKHDNCKSNKQRIFCLFSYFFLISKGIVIAVAMPIMNACILLMGISKGIIIVVAIPIRKVCILLTRRVFSCHVTIGVAL
ncbi:hypothetical protein BDQ17DRAFT_1305026 [Cyathus striatus]|nr:hypothetical protein BDQ17DRAFT_1305026 [Cyathus striatus]